MISLCSVVFVFSTLLSAFAIVYYYYFNRRANVPLLSEAVVLFSFFFCLNAICLLMVPHCAPSEVQTWLETMFYFSPLFVLQLMYFYRYESCLYPSFTIVFSVIWVLWDLNLQVVAILLYCFILPMWLLTCAERTLSSMDNVSAYLSLLLPGIYFCSGWFWYAETAFMKYSHSIEFEVCTKAIIVAVAMLIMFAILAMQIIHTGLFHIQLTGVQRLTSLILFVLFLIVTLAISAATFYIAFNRFSELLVSLDQHEWIITDTGLSVRDQALTEEIQYLELDMSICGRRSDRAAESLTQLINKYEMKHQQHWRMEMKLAKPLGNLYFLRGSLSYHHGRYDDAKNDLKESLRYNSNNAQAQFYIISSLNMLRNYSESIAYCKECVKKCDDLECKAVFQDYEVIAWQKYINKDLKPKAQKHREVNIPPSPPFDNLWPTHRQLAELSGVAYCIQRLSLPWRKISVYNDVYGTGYYGVAFENTQTKATVIAHRGTHLADSISPLLADYDLYRLVTPKQFDVAHHFTEQIRKKMSQNQILWHTGHSLGAAIAEFLVANETLFRSSTRLSFAVTFDSPGIMEILQEYHQRQKLVHVLSRSTEFHVISYLSAPNLVNTMGTHVGLTLRVSPFPPVFKAWHPLVQTLYSLMDITPFRKYKSVIDFFVTLANEQAHWHSLQTTIECFKLWPDESGLPVFITPVIKWPKGQQQLVRFLDLAAQKNLTTLDFWKYNWNNNNQSTEDFLNTTDEILYEFKRLDYHVVRSLQYPLRKLPLKLWSLEAQHFLEQFLTDRKSELNEQLAINSGQINVTIQLNPKCELLELLGEHGTRIIFSMLHWESFIREPSLRMVSIDDSAIPIYNGQAYEINILTLYTVLSVVNLDTCLLPKDSH